MNGRGRRKAGHGCHSDSRRTLELDQLRRRFIWLVLAKEVPGTQSRDTERTLEDLSPELCCRKAEERVNTDSQVLLLANRAS